MRIFRTVAVALCALSFTACLDETEELIVLGAVPAGDDCSGGGGDGSYLGRGIVDTTFAGGSYIAFFDLKNNLRGIDPANSSNGVDDSEMQLQDVIVGIRAPGTTDAISEYTLPLSTISIAGGKIVSVPVDIPIDLLVAATPVGAGEAAFALVDVRFRALRASNSSGKSNLGRVESRVFSHPIQVCSGCLRQCVPTLVTPEGATTPIDVCTPDACANNPPAVEGLACASVQDTPVSPICCDGVGTGCAP